MSESQNNMKFSTGISRGKRNETFHGKKQINHRNLRLCAWSELYAIIIKFSCCMRSLSLDGNWKIKWSDVLFRSHEKMCCFSQILFFCWSTVLTSPYMWKTLNFRADINVNWQSDDCSKACYRPTFGLLSTLLHFSIPKPHTLQHRKNWKHNKNISKWARKFLILLIEKNYNLLLTRNKVEHEAKNFRVFGRRTVFLVEIHWCICRVKKNIAIKSDCV